MELTEAKDPANKGAEQTLRLDGNEGSGLRTRKGEVVERREGSLEKGWH